MERKEIEFRKVSVGGSFYSDISGKERRYVKLGSKMTGRASGERYNSVVLNPVDAPPRRWVHDRRLFDSGDIVFVD
jgi:hypothetical protein